MQENYQISVVVPVFNAQHTLKRLIDSFLIQVGVSSTDCLLYTSPWRHSHPCGTQCIQRTGPARGIPRYGGAIPFSGEGEPACGGSGPHCAGLLPDVHQSGPAPGP